MIAETSNNKSIYIIKFVLSLTLFKFFSLIIYPANANNVITATCTLNPLRTVDSTKGNFGSR